MTPSRAKSRLSGFTLLELVMAMLLLTILIGMVFGIWALVVLARREVQEAFHQSATASSGKGCLIAGLMGLGVIVLIVLAIMGIRFMLVPRNHSRTQSTSTTVVGAEISLTLGLGADGLSDYFDPVTGQIFPAPNPPDPAQALSRLAKVARSIPPCPLVHASPCQNPSLIPSIP